MSVFDLRTWLDSADKLGMLRTIRGADPHLELGAACQLNYRRASPEALLFDDIIGHSSGSRVLTGTWLILSSSYYNVWH